MSIVKMSLYEALAKKKIYEDRVKNLDHTRLCDIKMKYDEKSSTGKDIKEVRAAIQSSYDKSVALVNNYNALRMAINHANAITEVEIEGKRYSIASAIAKFRGLDLEEAMYLRMKNNFDAIKKNVDSTNENKLSAMSVSNYVSKVLGDSKKDETIINSITETYKKDHEVEVYDPLNTEELATQKLEEIKLFRERIHYVLNKANIETILEIEFED